MTVERQRCVTIKLFRPPAFLSGSGLEENVFFLKFTTLVGYRMAAYSFFFVALLGYESLWALPLIVGFIAVYRQVFLGGRANWMAVAGYFGTFLLYFLVRSFVMLQEVSGLGTYVTLLQAPKELVLNVARFVSRALVPPQAETATGMGLTLAALAIMGILAYFTYKNKGKQAIGLVLVLLFATVLANLPTLPRGIDTHDSEGGRYIYFGSCFLVPCLVLAINFAFNNLIARRVAWLFLFCYFVFFLKDGQKEWVEASKIASNVIQQIQSIENCPQIYLLNLPGQLKGAYMFRQNDAYVQGIFYPEKKVKVLSKYPIDSASYSYQLNENPPNTWGDEQKLLKIQYFPTTKMLQVKNVRSPMFDHFDERVALADACFYYYSEGTLSPWKLQSK